MYKVRAILSDTEPMDDLIERFGFREIKVSGKYILLNGRPIRIKGFNRHEDHPMFWLRNAIAGNRAGYTDCDGSGSKCDSDISLSER